MAKYHLSPVTGKVEKCSAVKRCRYGGTHYPSREAGEKGQEAKDKFLAGNHNTPGETLARLAEDSHVDVRWRLAENPNTPGEILTELAEAPEWYVRQGVAGNPNTPEETLFLLAVDGDPRVIEAIKDNPRLKSWGVRL